MKYQKSQLNSRGWLCFSYFLREMLEQILRAKNYIHQNIRIYNSDKTGERMSSPIPRSDIQKYWSISKGPLDEREMLFCIWQGVDLNNLWLSSFQEKLISVSYFGVPNSTCWRDAFFNFKVHCNGVNDTERGDSVASDWSNSPNVMRISISNSTARI